MFSQQKNLDFSRFLVDGAKGARTPDLHAASVALSQLSYGPNIELYVSVKNYFTWRQMKDQVFS
jgi:hypothetical protein